MKKYIIITLLALSSCCNETIPPKKTFYYKLELLSEGKIVRVIHKTEVSVWREKLIEFTDDYGNRCFWGGEFFAKELSERSEEIDNRVVGVVSNITFIRNQ